MSHELIAALREPRAVHDLKNHICIIVGFTELLLQDCAAEDPRRSDIEEIHKSAQAALRLLPAAVGGRGE